ncbi:hypothetical protein ACFWBF_11055 [Streptomyces sp. NPDC060028]|uniref:hypothetical protein n=1 Tax=Streptomyces sp. NPDC060028 TaxID=3347041 RepID=UPI00368435A4
MAFTGQRASVRLGEGTLMPPAIDKPRTESFAQRCRLVTLDAANRVIDDGVLYVDGGRNAAVLRAAELAPPGFEDVMPIATEGTVYPGLIELHNHLPYDVLPLWAVPEKYGNRSQWGGIRNPAYRALVTGPIRMLGQDPQLMPAVVRYAEAKALPNGTTTTQGIALFSNAGARRMHRMHRGIVRNVEETDDPELPEAASRIADGRPRTLRSSWPVSSSRTGYSSTWRRVRTKQLGIICSPSRSGVAGGRLRKTW